MVDRAKYQVDRLKDEPNPIWIRELRQAARLARTPIILMVVAVLMTLLMASIGGIMSTSSSPAETGVVLFQVFFSLAFFVVVLIGPAVAANSIASEREGRTWEAVILTGMRPGEVARGKFFAAYTAIGMYIVMLAPVGALPFLFGGVTATETIVAFVFLFLIALLSVAFGLAISSKMGSLRAAILVTLLLAFPLSIVSFSSFGPLLSIAAHKAWPAVPEGPPIWLPSAYARAPFGIGYAVFLFLLPVAAVALPAWFLYEVTIANLTSVTDDRSTGLKRWFLVAAPVVTVAAALPLLAADPADADELTVGGVCVLVVFFSFCTFLFAGDPIGPSRRVKAMWEKTHAGRFRRFLGPGVMRSAWMLLISQVVSMAALVAFALIWMTTHGAATDSLLKAGGFAGFAFGFMIFVIGFAAWIRARASTPLVGRVLLFTVLFALAIGPWIVAAIAGLIADPGLGQDALVVAAPSPFYAFVMVASAKHGTETALIVGFAVAAIYAMLGIVLVGAAARRCAGIIKRHDAALAEAERLLAEEDAAMAAQAAPAAAS
jgi:ABC-type transport system involved in multi-copper enzyme maturation permease subunit